MLSRALLAELDKLLFETSHVNPEWFQQANSLLNALTQKEQDELEAHIESRYAHDESLKDGYSRLASYLLSLDRNLGTARRLFERDQAANRQSWFQQLKHAECVARQGKADLAQTMVRTTYDNYPQAVNGYAGIAWHYYWPRKDYSRLLQWLETDRRENRLTPGWELNLALAQAMMGQLENAREKVEITYRKDPDSKDGYSRIARFCHYPSGHYAQMLAYCVQDQKLGRITDQGRMTLAQAFLLSSETQASAAIIEELEAPAAKELVAAVEIWLDSCLWSLDAREETDPILPLLLQKYYLQQARTASLDAKLHEVLANLSLLRSRIAVLSESWAIDLHSQLGEIAARQNRDRINTEPILFLDAKLEYANPADLLVLFHEIVLSESDHFETTNDSPVIIDGGANIGMAIAYFKFRYPRSQILAFEPNPDLYDICRRNIELNCWQDVQLFPYALADRAETISFYCDQEMPMASSTNNRAAEEGREFNATEVEAKPLSQFIEQQIDFLKLDIEGAESAVLEVLEPKLDLVCRGIIEYHYGFEDNPLSSILSILERNGFAYIINEPYSAKRKTGLQSLKNRWSRSIFFSKVTR